jgi:transcriptional regulator with XRE-family HTH domain
MTRIPGGDLAARMKACRTAFRRLTPVLADHLAGVSRGMTSKLEGSNQNPTRETLLAFARLYNCKVGWLAAGEDQAPTLEDVRIGIERAGVRFGRYLADAEEEETAA